MIEQTWMQFESTGRIDDYLAYSRAQKEEIAIGTSSNMKERDQKNGADHSAYRYGVSSNTRGGL